MIELPASALTIPMPTIVGTRSPCRAGRIRRVILTNVPMVHACMPGQPAARHSAQPLTGFLLVFPRGNAPTTLWFSLPLAFFVRGLGLVLVLVGRALASGEVWLVVLVVLLDISKVGGGAQSRARDVCEVRIRLKI